jgi:RimJ/RimL family protein N-acetyltransferase
MGAHRVDLVPRTRESALAMVEAMNPADRAQVSADWLARVHAAAPIDPWVFGFTVVLVATGTAIGQAGFKAAPTEGVVEIAYGTDAGFRGQGYATEAAAALVAFAFADPRVDAVRAHTMRGAHASARVLTKCGFHLLGEVMDPDDGLVRRWERARDPAIPQTKSRGHPRTP